MGRMVESSGCTRWAKDQNNRPNKSIDETNQHSRQINTPDKSIDETNQWALQIIRLAKHKTSHEYCAWSFHS
jgi:hypothetical protein